MDRGIFSVSENAEIADSVFRMELLGDAREIRRPGQFVDVEIDGLFLRRPISVCDWDEGSMVLIYKVVGEGTQRMSRMKPGAALDLLVGLGNGFDASKSGDRPLLVGGGVGVPPLYGLAKRLASDGKRPAAALGFNGEKDVFYVDEFRALGVETLVATVDGTFGTKGFATDLRLRAGADAARGARRDRGRRAVELRTADGLRLRRVHGLLVPDEVREQAHLQGRPGA